MSVEAFSRVLYAPLGGNPKVILLGIANHAWPDGTNAYPAMETLAEYAHCDRRTAQRNTRKLEDDGWIEREGIGPAGQWRWRIVFERWEGDGQGGDGGRQNAALRQNAAGGKSGTGGAAPAPPEPSLNRQGEEARARDGADPRMKAPPNFPDDLRPHAREVYRVLVAVAEQHNARKVWPLAVGRVIMAHPRHPLVATAHALAAWAVDPPRPIRDVVGTYRTFLDQPSCRELASTEFLADDGTPAAPNGNGRLPDGVTPIRQESAAERRIARHHRRRAMIEQAEREAAQQPADGPS